MQIPVLINKILATNPCVTEMFEDKGKIYTFLNPVSYLEALKNKELFSKFDGIFVDGKFLALAIRLFYRKKVKRCSFDMTALAPQLFRYSEECNKSVYIVASNQKEVEASVAIFKSNFPKLNIAGFRNGFFKNIQEQNEEFHRIIALNPDFVICGMGTVKQESFLCCLKDQGYQGIAFTCGGFVSQTSQRRDITYYPRLFDVLDIRFLYRMLKEKHTRKRYLRAFFCFPVKFVKDFF